MHKNAGPRFYGGGDDALRSHRLGVQAAELLRSDRTASLNIVRSAADMATCTGVLLATPDTRRRFDPGDQMDRGVLWPVVLSTPGRGVSSRHFFKNL